MKRTDLICEYGVVDSENKSSFVHECAYRGTAYTDIRIDENNGKEYGLRAGRYITIFTGSEHTEECLEKLLGEMIPDGAVLVAGLGNINICSDSIGVRTLSHIPATAHLSGERDFKELGLRSVYVLEAGVTGKTGIESSRKIRCIAAEAGVQSIVAIDSLACSGLERLCTTIQLTDAGISPGSGVGNDRQALDRETAGVPVIAIGVPTVIDLDSITGDKTNIGLMVTPRNIDAVTGELAGIIGRAVSRALNPSLSSEEIKSLIIL